ncbi:MAG: exodeoxyribonuclease V subunit gamma, partial [Anaerolineales bacterium]|nr:exodeoxyribonuclease V subunit gamma [Anaerolineales bacterium]
ERVQAALADRPLAPVWVVLPDRLQVASFRRRLAAHGGAIGARIGTFGDLYHEVLDAAGTPVPVACETAAAQFVNAVIAEATAQGSLAHYGGIAAYPGFARELRRVFAELKRARVQPERFMEMAKDMGPALLELADLYQAYQVMLQQAGWADPEGLSWLATKALEDAPALLASVSLVIVDGFDSFNGSQRQALRLLADRGGELVVTLPGGLAMDRPAFRRFARSLEGLRQNLPEASITTAAESPYLPPPLRALEQGLFNAATAPTAGAEHVRMIEARSPAEEAREALRWIKRRILRDGVRLDQCALVTPSPEQYRPLLRRAGAECGILLRFTMGEPLTSAPGIAALLGLLELPSQNWPRRLTLDVVRSPYFDLSRYGLTEGDALLLDRASLKGLVIEGLDQWDEALLALAALDGPPEDEDSEGASSANLPYGASAARLLEALRRMVDRLSPSGERPTAGWVEWLEDLLDETGFFTRRETPVDQAALRELREALRALVAAGEVIAQPAHDYGGFVGELHGLLESTFLTERLRSHDPAVQVLHVLEARNLRYRAVAVLGLSEGQFPEVEREDRFLNETVRETLGLEPRLVREQAGLFYQAVTRADDYLLLTRPYSAEDGEKWEPSPFWRACDELFEEAPVRIRPDAPRALNEAASAEELLFWAVRRRSLPREFTEDLLPRWERLQHSRQVVSARQSREAEGRFEGDLGSLTEALLARYGPEAVWSATRLEAYGTCPYLFLAQHGLRLEPSEPPEPGIDAAQLGSLLHAVLEKAYREAGDRTSLDSVQAALEATAREAFRGAPRRYGFRPTALWDIMQEQLLEKLAETIAGLSEIQEDWEPVEFEAAFGVGEAPALVVQLEGEPLRLRGIVDRVDRNPAGELRIIDYKSGSSHLALRDLIEGRRLQLPLYALGVREALGLGVPVEGFYWTIFQAQPGALRLSRFQYAQEALKREGVQGAIDTALDHVIRAVQGVRAGRFAPSAPRGGCPSYCPATVWCWRYAPEGWS